MSKEYSFAEVEKHNNGNDLWVVIHNEIFDVTAFKNEHPGGEDVLLEQAGKDGSQPFENADHSSDAREMMRKFKVGDIIEAERVTKIASGGRKGCNCDSAKFKCLIASVAVGAVAVLVYCLYRSRK